MPEQLQPGHRYYERLFKQAQDSLVLDSTQERSVIHVPTLGAAALVNEAFKISPSNHAPDINLSTDGQNLLSIVKGNNRRTTMTFDQAKVVIAGLPRVGNTFNLGRRLIQLRVEGDGYEHPEILVYFAGPLKDVLHELVYGKPE